MPARHGIPIEFPTNPHRNFSYRLAIQLESYFHNRTTSRSSQIQPLQFDAMSRYSWVIAVVIFASLYLAFASHLPSHQKQPTATELKYSRAHSLGNGYTFDPRDGWQTVNVSNLSYKYGPHSPNSRRTTKAYSSHGALPNKVKAATPHPLHDTIPKKVTGIMKTVLNGLKGLGKSETVTTTW